VPSKTRECSDDAGRIVAAIEHDADLIRQAGQLEWGMLNFEAQRCHAIVDDLLGFFRDQSFARARIYLSLGS
jgi:hypothetical protein